MMMLIVALSLLGMVAFYSLIAYLLIRIISKKAFKVTLTKLEIIEIITWLSLIFLLSMRSDQEHLLCSCRLSYFL